MSPSKTAPDTFPSVAKLTFIFSSAYPGPSVSTLWTQSVSAFNVIGASSSTLSCAWAESEKKSA